MNTTLILEEYIRDRRDIQTQAYLAFLDAKSAFDVVSHKSLIPKLLNIGVEGNLWTIINSLHQDARSAAKFARSILLLLAWLNTSLNWTYFTKCSMASEKRDPVRRNL